MQKSTLKWLRYLPFILILIGVFEAGRQLVKGGLDGLVQLAQGCRDLLWAGPADYLSLLQLNDVSFSVTVWLIGGGILLFVGGGGVYAVHRNWEFLSILNYYCTLLAESAVQFSSNRVIRLLVWPIKVCFVFLASIFIPIQCFRDQRRRLPERVEAELVENDLSTIEV